jgi:hypothetical protein
MSLVLEIATLTELLKGGKIDKGSFVQFCKAVTLDGQGLPQEDLDVSVLLPLSPTVFGDIGWDYQRLLLTYMRSFDGFVIKFAVALVSSFYHTLFPLPCALCISRELFVCLLFFKGGFSLPPQEPALFSCTKASGCSSPSYRPDREEAEYSKEEEEDEAAACGGG